MEGHCPDIGGIMKDSITIIDQEFIDLVATNKTNANINFMYTRNLNSENIKKLAIALKLNNKITGISFLNCKINHQDIKEIAEILKINNNITGISFKGCKMGYESAKVVVEALKLNKSITSVSFADNNIGYKGAQIVIEALENNKLITEISLSSNDIGFKGAKLVAEFLKKNKTITKISIAHNRIGDEGAREMAEAIKLNDTLTFISLEGNWINDNGIKEICETLKLNRAITTINLNGNYIGDEGTEAIVKALEENKNITNLKLTETMYYDGNDSYSFMMFDEKIAEFSLRNREFLAQAVRDFENKTPLDVEQNKTLIAHLDAVDNNSKDVFPRSTRDGFVENLKRVFGCKLTNIATFEDKSKALSDSANQISEFIGSLSEVSRFNQEVRPVKQYFRNFIDKITPEMDVEYNRMIELSGSLKDALKFPSNAKFIADELNRGMEFVQITENLVAINKDPKTLAYALANPKKLGYLMTLDKNSLTRAVTILNDQTLGDFVMNNPEQIAQLVKTSVNPEILSNAVSELKGLKRMHNNSENNVNKRVKLNNEKTVTYHH